MSKISVIIPAHNEEKYIKQTLHSIKQQTFQNYESIVVSNGCTDETEPIMRKKEAQDNKLKHFSISTANVSIARNHGAKEAEGQILLFLDADTLLEPDALQKIHSQFTTKYSVATTLAKPDIQNIRFNFSQNYKNFIHWTGIYGGCSGALICRKEDFDQVGGYPEIVVKEHRKLIIALKRKTNNKFKCVDTHVTTSMRRFQKWGLTKSSLFWVGQWVKNYVGDLKKSKYEKVR